MSKQPKKTVTAYGAIEYTVDGELHRLDGPAVEGANGNKQWWANDKLVARVWLVSK